MLSLNQMHYFVTTVEQGSINKASKKLFISQPALTKQLSQLEKEMNCILFLRHSSGIELTIPGRMLYEKSRSIIEQIVEMENEVKEYGLRLTMKIGALPSLSSHYIPNLLAKSNWNDMNMEVTTKDTTIELIEMIRKKEIHAAFVQDFKGNGELATIDLFTEPYMAIVPSSSPLCESEMIYMKDLIKEPFILHKDPCDIRSAFRTFCSKEGINMTPKIELDFNESILTFVASNQGVSIVPKIAADHLIHPDIIVKEVENHRFYRKIQLVYSHEYEENVMSLFKMQNEETTSL